MIIIEDGVLAAISEAILDAIGENQPGADHVCTNPLAPVGLRDRTRQRDDCALRGGIDVDRGTAKRDQ
jgi:hypothetical protein